MRLLVRRIGFFSFLFLASHLWSQTTRLDTSLKPKKRKDVPEFYEAKGAIKNKAMIKDSRFLLYGGLSRDFSDGPFSMMIVNTGLGYALNDEWEFYLTASPLFMVQERSIVKEVSQLEDIDENPVSITFQKPKYQFGGEILWAPGYGKDSLGISKVIRSDTFLKIGGKMTFFELDKGFHFTAGVGKTFFLGKYLGLRMAVSYNYMQNIINEEKVGRNLLILELGSVFYL